MLKKALAQKMRKMAADLAYVYAKTSLEEEEGAEEILRGVIAELVELAYELDQDEERSLDRVAPLPGEAG